MKNSTPHRIAQRDGLLTYTSSDGEIVALSRLAIFCEFRLDRLCEELNLSARHLRRLFDQAIGVSPKQWLKLERMVYARTILRDTKPIKEVAQILGFSSQKQFLREFQEYYEVAPSSYRSQQGQRIMSQLGWAN